MNIGKAAMIAAVAAMSLDAAQAQVPIVPESHIPYIIDAARQANIDPALIAATAAKESNFGPNAFREEPGLARVSWEDWVHFDGSLGPMQVLRSNFKAYGIHSDAQAMDLATNYLIGALILRRNLDRCGSIWGAATAYNGGSCAGYTTPGYAAHVVSLYRTYKTHLNAINASRCRVSAQHVRDWYAEFLGRSAAWEEISGRIGRDCEAARAEIMDSVEAIRRKAYFAEGCAVRPNHVIAWYNQFLSRPPENWGAIAGNLERDCNAVRQDIKNSREAQLLAFSFDRY